MGSYATCPDCTFQCKLRPLAVIKIKERVKNDLFIYLFVLLFLEEYKQFQITLMNLLTKYVFVANCVHSITNKDKNIQTPLRFT